MLHQGSPLFDARRLVAFCFAVLGCSEKSAPPSARDPATGAPHVSAETSRSGAAHVSAETARAGAAHVSAETPALRRPKVSGDVQHGWALFREHCIACHGAGRRGTGARANDLPARPADLRDPLLLASRTDNQLAEAILRGIVVPPERKKRKDVKLEKDMPGFAKELGEQDVLDLIAFLRGDSIFLEECFANATHYLLISEAADRSPPLISAHAAAGASRPVLVKTATELPSGATLVGYLTFVELDIPGTGPTPVAFLANTSGEITGARVALAEPDNDRARKDFEAAIGSGEAATRLRPLLGALEATKRWMKEVVAARQR